MPILSLSLLYMSGRDPATPRHCGAGAGKVLGRPERGIGKPWENHRNMVVFRRFLWDLPSGKRKTIGTWWFFVGFHGTTGTTPSEKNV